MYAKFLKRLIDIILSLTALILLSPLLTVTMIIGLFAMRGNPFFVQPRPGRKRANGEERIFNLIKFRSMNNRKDKEGNLLPDEDRLTGYGKFLRKTSIDELPELINILKGDMSFVGPRPLLVRYLDRYTPRQRHRHDVLPGLTGWAQVNGRNAISWEEKFEFDLWYTEHISFGLDVKIFFMTIGNVLKRDGISSATSATMEEFMGSENKE
ncbi:MAG: sugar transferase [Lachnospiraceae bacterium]|nr:sugar transferase [Lachnospiraceae bacterium]